MKQKVRVGIAGLGNHAIQPHLAKLLKMSDVEIVGAFDPDISKFDKANEILGTKLKFFNSYQELCFASDAVVICSPDKVHFSQLMIAVKEYGCHVLVEKPILTDKSQVKEFEELLMSTNKVIMPCYPHRFDPVYIGIKKWVNRYNKRESRIESVDVYFDCPAPSRYERCKQGNLPFIKQVCRNIDLMNYVFGCERFVAKANLSKEADLIMGHRVDDIYFSFSRSRKLKNISQPQQAIAFEFKRAQLKIDNQGKARLSSKRRTYCDSWGDSYTERLVFEREVKLPRSDKDAAYKALNRNFIDSILGKADPYLTKEEILMAAVKPLDYVSK